MALLTDTFFELFQSGDGDPLPGSSWRGLHQPDVPKEVDKEEDRRCGGKEVQKRLGFSPKRLEALK